MRIQTRTEIVWVSLALVLGLLACGAVSVLAGWVRPGPAIEANIPVALKAATPTAPAVEPTKTPVVKKALEPTKVPTNAPTATIVPTATTVPTRASEPTKALEPIAHPVLTMADVAPWIAKMGNGGHPGHDVVGNTQCAYWLDPKYIGFADDTGPNTSGVEQSEGVFRFDLEAIAKYKMLPTDVVFVTEAAWTGYRGAEYEQAFLVTTGRDTIDLTGAAIFALPNPASVEPFLALRQAHLICRGYEDSIVDFRSGSPVVTYTARVTEALVPTVEVPKPTPIPGKTPAPTSVPASTAVNATYEFGANKGTITKAECVELKGASGTLAIDIRSGGFATSGRASDATDWQLAKSAGAGKYTTQWTGWLLCFDADSAKAEASLIATDSNAKGNDRVTWQPAK